jgi:hypothetical protein
MVELLIKENQELKNLLVNQKFVLQPVNPYQLSSQNQIVQTQSQIPTNQPSISIPFNDALLSGNTQLGLNDQPTQSQPQTQPAQTQSQPSQAQSRTYQSQSRSQPSSAHALQHQSQHDVQRQPQVHSQSQQQLHQQQTQPNAAIDSSLAETSGSNGILRFINNQYVDDENTLSQQANNSQSSNSRIDFVFMDPAAASKSRGHYRSNSSTFPDHGEDEDDDDEMDDDDDQTSPLSHLSPPTTQSTSTGNGSRLQRSSTRQGEYDAENYDLIIHNDFNKVEDIYYEYYNSLKPQVERVQKAYKIKKIRKYQKIKALAVRVDRYKELKGCSLGESFEFFDNLRIAEDNTKRSIAWLYNTLPDVLKKLGLEDQLKRSGTGA